MSRLTFWGSSSRDKRHQTPDITHYTLHITTSRQPARSRSDQSRMGNEFGDATAGPEEDIWPAGSFRVGVGCREYKVLLYCTTGLFGYLAPMIGSRRGKCDRKKFGVVREAQHPD